MSFLPPARNLFGVRREPELAPIRPADQRPAVDFISAHKQAHVHLDWQSLPDLIADQRLLGWVVREGRAIQALTGATIVTPPPAVRAGVADRPAAWVRLVAGAAGADAYLDMAWEPLRQRLADEGAVSAAVLMMNAWVERYARRWNFELANRVITLRRDDRDMPPVETLPVTIRDATLADSDAIVRVDNAAFEPLWQYDRAMLDMAVRHAATLTIAEQGSAIVGYQLSTWHIESGHLARLAVEPRLQGRGIGRLLVAEMLRFFAERKTFTITVNTQEDNIASQRLYTSMGFRYTDQAAPVWAHKLAE